MLANIFIFILGASLGSFLNVCIYRLPRGESIAYPSSHCVHCNHAIPWFDNIPFLGYILLRGRCRFCARPISIRYVTVELITGVLFLLFYISFGFGILFLQYSILALALILSSAVDLEYQLIPDVVTIPGMLIGLLIAVLFPGILGYTNRIGGFLYSLTGILVGGGSVYLLGVLGEFIFKKEAMGGGDVKLLAMIGAFLGWKSVLLVFFLAPFSGAAVGIVTKLKKGENIIPYGPHISIAAIIAIFFSERILNYLFFY